MAEATPSKKSGHAYGRRFQKISNTAEEGELCIYSGHALGRFSSHSMRYDSHQACIRCVRNAREGMISLDINRLLKKNRQRALKFWSKVDIGAPDDCWLWHGAINVRTDQPQFPWRRTGISSSTQHHPQRVAMWFSWGDLGFTGVKTTCGNKYCCNPFHLIPQHVGVFVDHQSYLESHDIACEIHTLKQAVQEYLVEEAMKEQTRLDQTEEIDARAALLLNPTTDFSQRFEAVITDMLAGQHITQTDSDTEGLYREPVDNEEESTDEF